MADNNGLGYYFNDHPSPSILVQTAHSSNSTEAAHGIDLFPPTG